MLGLTHYGYPIAYPIPNLSIYIYLVGGFNPSTPLGPNIANHRICHITFKHMVIYHDCGIPINIGNIDIIIWLVVEPYPSEK